MEPNFNVLLSVAERIGTNGFYAAMMRAVFQAMPSYDCQVIHFPAAGAPSYVVDDHTSPHLRRLYNRFCPYDPFYRDWQSHHHAGIRTLREVHPPDYDEGGYTTGFYGRTGYADEVALVFPALIGSAIGVFIQRDKMYRAEEVDTISALFPSLRHLHASHRRHIYLAAAPSLADRRPRGLAIVERSGRITFATEALRDIKGYVAATAEAIERRAVSRSPAVATRLGTALVTPLGDFPLAPHGSLVVFGSSCDKDDRIESALDSFGAGLLSPRERQITRFTFAGYGNAHIADALGVREGTVKNLRKRLYFKMDVTCERELFALFLDHMRVVAVRDC